MPGVNVARALTHIGATSTLIRQALANDYGHHTTLLLPPCVDPTRYHPHEVADDDPLWPTLAEASGLPTDVVRSRPLVTEVSRTDRTKRKDVLLRAFAKLPHPALLALTIDERQQQLASELHALIDALDLRGHVAVLGSVWDLLPSLYAATSVYCTPSVMEGFGMSAQEAAASGAPVIASDLVPFAVEHLQPDGGALIAPADDADAFAKALARLLSDDDVRRHMGRRAHDITVPAFTWPTRTRAFLDQCGVPQPGR